jgi:hypothetical protein
MGDIDVNQDHNHGNCDRSFADEGNQWKTKTPHLILSNKRCSALAVVADEA